MKKCLYLIASMLLMLTMLVSCSDDDHEHTFDTETWASDLNNHWHVATCEHTNEVSDTEAHIDENNDGVCDICEYQICEHELSTIWSHDENQHWHIYVCDCDIPNADIGAHVDANNDSICDTCAWDYDHDHVFSETWTGNATHHWHTIDCGHNVANDNKDKAYGMHIDADENGICDGCELEIAALAD